MSPDKISFTAWVVMRCMAALHRSKRWRELVDTDEGAYYEQALDYCGDYSGFYKIHRHIPPCVSAFCVDRLQSRGMSRHYALRKNAIRRIVETSIAQGAHQLVVLGGGFDIGGAAIAKKYPTVRVFEIDMPGMHAHKKKVLERFYSQVPANFTGIAADLSEQSLAQVLSSHKDFDPGAQTMFVAEGLSMYLSPEAFAGLLAQVRAYPGAELVFTAIADQLQMKHSLGQSLNRHVLNSVGESTGFGIAPEQMQAYLAGQGYKLENMFLYADLQKELCGAREYALLKRQNGEYIVHARAG